MNRFFLITMLIGAAGCSTLRKSDTVAFQGRWLGKEIGAKTPGVCYLVVSGDNAEFRGADTNEWYQATFTLREDTKPKQVVCLTTGSSYPPMIGIARYGIYQMEDGMVRLTINEAGDTSVPSRFD